MRPDTDIRSLPRSLAAPLSHLQQRPRWQVPSEPGTPVGWSRLLEPPQPCLHPVPGPGGHPQGRSWSIFLIYPGQTPSCNHGYYIVVITTLSYIKLIIFGSQIIWRAIRSRRCAACALQGALLDQATSGNHEAGRRAPSGSRHLMHFVLSLCRTIAPYSYPIYAPPGNRHGLAGTYPAAAN